VLTYHQRTIHRAPAEAVGVAMAGQDILD